MSAARKLTDMEVLIEISKELDQDEVKGFLSALKIPNLSSDRVLIPAQNNGEEGIDSNVFRLSVVLGGEEFDEDDTQAHLDNQRSSLFLFNPELTDQHEPKVIYMTDNSTKASFNLEVFKRLKPGGFAGATVISETETNPSRITWNEMSQQILDRIRFAVQSSRANLIIANYDLGGSGRKFSRMACLAKLVRQNKCHVLILKT